MHSTLPVSPPPPSPTAPAASGPPLPPFDDATPAREVLAWAVDTHPDLVLATALGPQSVAILELLHQLGRPVDTVFLDTGLHFPETYALRLRLQHRYRRAIRVLRPDQTVAQQAVVHGDRLWARDPDRCCALRKVAPLDAVLAGRSAWVTGLRRSDAPLRQAVRPVEWDARRGLVKVNPLAAWSRAAVRAFLRSHGVPTHPLLEQGFRSVGCAPCTRPTPQGGSERAGRWADRAKTECGIHHLYADPATVAGGVR